MSWFLDLFFGIANHGHGVPDKWVNQHMITEEPLISLPVGTSEVEGR